MRKILLLSESGNIQPDPAAEAAEKLQMILSQDFELDVMTTADMLPAHDLQKYKAVVSFTDGQSHKYKTENLTCILDYISRGGCLLKLHNNLNNSHDHELPLLHGGLISQVYPYTIADFHITAKEHPITRNLEDFTIEEVPVSFEFSPLVKKDVLIECVYGEQTFPALWCRPFQFGKVINLSICHTSESLSHPVIQQLIRRSLLWGSDLI